MIGVGLLLQFGNIKRNDTNYLQYCQNATVLRRNQVMMVSALL